MIIFNEYYIFSFCVRLSYKLTKFNNHFAHRASNKSPLKIPNIQYNPEYNADHAPLSPSIPRHNHSPHHKPFTPHPHEPTPGLVRTALYRAVTADTAIKHPHPAEPRMPSFSHRVPGMGNSPPYPRAGPFVHPS